MAGARSKADIENGPDCQHGELNALQQAQWTGKLAERQLRRESARENSRYRIEPDHIEGYCE